MGETAAIATARQTVATLRGEGAAAGSLAKALLALARAEDASGETGAAFTAARDGIAALSDAFVARPDVEGETMTALVALYLSLARRTGTPADEALLKPIAAAQGGVIRREDDADEW